MVMGSCFRVLRVPVVLLVASVVFPPAWSVATAHGQSNSALQCFRIKDPLKIEGVVDLDSAQYGLSAGCRLGRATRYCVPVTRSMQSVTANDGPLSFLNVSGPRLGDQICYRIKCSGASDGSQEVSDALGHRVVRRGRARTLCLPAIPGPPVAATAGSGMCVPSDEIPPPSEFIPTCLSGGGPPSGVIRNIVGDGAPTLRVLGAYDSAGVPGGTSENTVHVASQENVVLVLAAYEETHWVVTAAAGATIQQIVVTGYEQQYVTAPSGVPVDNLTPRPVHPIFEDSRGSTLIPDDWPSTEADELVAAAEVYTGLCLTSYHYCYGGGEFVVPEY